MILYSNGSGHTAAAEAINTCLFAEEDRTHFALKRGPHPDNLRVSYGVLLSEALKTAFFTEAQCRRTGRQVIQTTKEWINRTKENIEPIDVLMVIEIPDETLHDEVIAFHIELNKAGYKHIFFNANKSYFGTTDQYNFGAGFMDPYLPEGSFSGYLHSAGFDTVITSNEHFGPSAHAAWSNHVLRYIIENRLI